MTRYVVDAGTVLRLAEEGRNSFGECTLLAPTLVRSQVVAALHERVVRDDLNRKAARELLTRATELPVRLLGDRVLRRRALDLALDLGWDSTFDAEYVALTQLQADALVADDPALAGRARGVVELASYDELASRQA